MSYEFTHEENETFLAFVVRILLLSFSSILAGSLLLIYSFDGGFKGGYFLFSIGMFVLAVTFLSPIKNIQNIILTSGNDIEELVEGIEKTNKFFYGSIVIFWLLAIFTTITFIITLVEFI
ncbi:MAG: hypothetical protein D6732_07905 [Methanobacteriota archaeon]|nr:MAG: hypothetical protein D6732_07905 [Euryarchaeota archaeon]